MPAPTPSKIEHVYVTEEDILPPEDGRALAYTGATGRDLLNKRYTGFTRGEITKAFHRAFEMIGGTTRLALWADQNPGEFFKIYGKLLPSSSQVDLTGEQTIVVKHVLNPPHDYKADAAQLTEPGDEDDDA